MKLKYLLPLLAMLTLSVHVSATEYIDNGSNGLTQNQNQYNNSNSKSDVKVTNKDRFQIPGGSGNLGAVSTTTTSPHRYVDAYGVSIVWGMFSWNATNMKFDIVSFVASNPTEESQLAACIISQEFRQYRALSKKECPVISTPPSPPLK